MSNLSKLGEERIAKTPKTEQEFVELICYLNPSWKTRFERGIKFTEAHLKEVALGCFHANKNDPREDELRGSLILYSKVGKFWGTWK